MFGRKKDKEVLVYIKQEPRDIVVKRPVEVSSDGTKAYITILTDTENRAGWKFDATGCLRVNAKGRLYCEVIRGAQKAIKFDLENKEYNLSKLTNDEMQQFINMKIFKSHYGKLLADLLNALKPYLIVVAGLVAVTIALSAFNAYQSNEIMKAIHSFQVVIKP